MDTPPSSNESKSVMPSTSSNVESSSDSKHSLKKINELLKKRKQLIKKRRELEQREVNFDDEEEERSKLKQEDQISRILLKLEEKLHRYGVLTNIQEDNLPFFDRELRPKISISDTGDELLNQHLNKAMQSKIDAEPKFALNCFLDYDEICHICKSVREEQLTTTGSSSIPQPKTTKYDELIETIVCLMKKSILEYRYGDHEKNLDSYLTVEEKQQLDAMHVKENKPTDLAEACNLVKQEPVDKDDDDDIICLDDDDEEEEEVVEEEEETSGSDIVEVNEERSTDDRRVFGGYRDFVVNVVLQMAEDDQADRLNKINETANQAVTTATSTAHVKEEASDVIGAKRTNKDADCSQMETCERANNAFESDAVMSSYDKTPDEMVQTEEHIDQREEESQVPPITPPVGNHNDSRPNHDQSPPEPEESRLKPDWLVGSNSNELATCYVNHLKEDDVQLVYLPDECEYGQISIFRDPYKMERVEKWIAELVLYRVECVSINGEKSSGSTVSPNSSSTKKRASDETQDIRTKHRRVEESGGNNNVIPEEDIIVLD